MSMVKQALVLGLGLWFSCQLSVTAQITRDLVEKHRQMFERIIVQVAVSDRETCRAIDNPVLDNLIPTEILPVMTLHEIIYIFRIMFFREQLMSPEIFDINRYNRISEFKKKKVKEYFENNLGGDLSQANFYLQYPSASRKCNLYEYLTRFLNGENVRVLELIPNPNNPYFTAQAKPIGEMTVFYFLRNGEHEEYVAPNEDIIYPYYIDQDLPLDYTIEYQENRVMFERKRITLNEFFEKLARANAEYMPQLWVPNMTSEENMRLAKPIQLIPSWFEEFRWFHEP